MILGEDVAYVGSSLSAGPSDLQYDPVSRHSHPSESHPWSVGWSWWPVLWV